MGEEGFIRSHGTGTLLDARLHPVGHAVIIDPCAPHLSVVEQPFRTRRR